MVSAPSFSQPCLYIQPPLQSQPKIWSSTSANFHLPILALLFNKIILTIPTNTLYLYTSALFHLPIFTYKHPSNQHQKYFPYFSYLVCSDSVKGPRSYGAMEKHCFNLSLLPQSMDSDNRVHNHWFLITQAKKIGVLQEVSDGDICNWNSKLSSSPSFILSSYCHYFHTLLSQELTFLNLFKVIFILRLTFSYSIHAPLHPYV